MSFHKQGAQQSLVHQDDGGIMRQTRFDKLQVSTAAHPLPVIGLPDGIGAAVLSADLTGLGSDCIAPGAEVWVTIASGATWQLPTIAQFVSRYRGAPGLPGDGWYVHIWGKGGTVALTQSADITAEGGIASPFSITGGDRFLMRIRIVSPTDFRYTIFRDYDSGGS